MIYMLRYPPLEWTRWLRLWAARSSDPRGRACRPNGKGTGKEGVLSDIVLELFILPDFRVNNVSPGV